MREHRSPVTIRREIMQLLDELERALRAPRKPSRYPDPDPHGGRAGIIKLPETKSGGAPSSRRIETD